MDSTVFGGDVFGFDAGVFSAVEGADGINLAYSFALGVVTQPGADIGQFTAGAASQAPASAGLIHR